MFLHDHPLVESNILEPNSHQVPKLWQTCRAAFGFYWTATLGSVNVWNTADMYFLKKHPLNGCKMGVGLEKRERVMRYLMICFLQNLILCAFGINIWAWRTCEVHKSQGWQFFLSRIRPLCLSQHLTCKSVGVDVIYQTTPQRVRNQNTTSFAAVI